jgi:leader peptidase (prepilin peptidase)/N-methyltransferase
MDYVFVGVVALAVLGLLMGSFAGATVWRLRALQLAEDEKEGEKVTDKEKKQVAKLKKTTLLKDRSVCLHCGHQLEGRDLIPLVSWLSLKGKCRYCHKSIGWMEPAIELGMAVFFALSFVTWHASLVTPLAGLQFVLWLLAGVGLAILFVYDARWFLLPDRVTYPLIALSALYALLVLLARNFAPLDILSVVDACIILSGLYYLIYVVSKHQWVGFGDVKLGLVLALLLADWKLAALALFLANVIGTIIVIPMMLKGRLERRAHIPFGPLLISGWVLAGLFGHPIVTWYTGLTFGM